MGAYSPASDSTKIFALWKRKECEEVILAFYFACNS